MKALEVTRTIDEKDRLILAQPLTLDNPDPVGIILLLPEPKDEAEDDPDDTRVAEVKASLKRSLQFAKTGQRIPLSQMWECLDRF